MWVDVLIIGQKKKGSIESFGRNLGICFQITDDILDYSAKEKVFGKKIGNDFLEGKITLPIILLFQKSNKIERQTLNKFFSQNIRNQDDFNKTLGLIKKYKIIETCKKRADYFSNVAADSCQFLKKILQLKNYKNYLFILLTVLIN